MKLNYTLKSMAVIILIGAISGCEKNGPDNTNEHGYLLLFRTSTDPTADYLVTTQDLMTGSISATGTGVELQGWSYYAKAGGKYLTFDYDNSIAKGFELKDGALTEVGQFAFERMDCFSKGADDNTLVAIGAPWGGGSFDCKIQIVDGNSISIANAVTTPIYVSHDSAGAQLNAWPTGSFIQGGKLYVSFYPLHGESWATQLTDTAYVSVYSYPGLQYIETFKDTRTGPIGHYSSQPCILEDESGNHYTISNTSMAGGFTQSTKPGGILKINNGASQFDQNYFFNTEALGYKVMGGVYAGNGKVVARVISVATDQSAAMWAAFTVTEPIHKIAVIDLNAQSLTIVNDVPLHGGQYLTPFLLEDGKVYASITESTTDAFIYQIDAATATAVKGARIAGSEIQALYKY